MDDASVVKIMQSLGLDYNPAINATKQFEKHINSLNKQLAELKMTAMQSTKDINSIFSSQLSTLAGNKTIVDQYGVPLKTVQTQMQNLAKTSTNGFISATDAVKKHSQSVEDLGKQYNILASEFRRRMSWFLTGTVFYGSIKAAKEAVKTISEVEMGMVEIGRVIEDSTFRTKEFRDELLQLGKDYGYTFETVQDIALRWAQAGYNIRDTLENTRVSLLALNTAELDAQNATESLIGIMAQWGLTSQELPLVLDKINKTADDFTITSQDLVDGLLRSSSAAKIMNLSIDETIALLTVMREASGRTGREVGNALNSILSYIQRPASINVLESLGIGVFADEARTQFRSVMEIFQDIASKWETTSESIKDGFVQAADDAGLFSEELATALGLQEQWNDLQQRDIAQASAGVYRRNYFIGMIERLAEAQKVLNGLTDAAGYSQAENARTMETLEKKYQSLKTAVQELAVALGDAGLLDTLKGLTEGATNAASAISDLTPEMKAFLTTALEIIGITAALKGVIGLFTDRALFVGATAILPGMTKLLAIIPVLAGAIGLYIHNLNSATDATNGLRDKQEELEKSFNSQIEAAEETKENMLSQAKTAETLANKLEELTKKEELNIAEKAQMKAIVEKLNNIFPDLNLAIDENTDKIIGNTQAIYDNIEALKQRAIAQGYEAKMAATASAYVSQESLLGQTMNELEKANAELNEIKKKYSTIKSNAQKEIDEVMQNYIGLTDVQPLIIDIQNKYGLTELMFEISKREKAIQELTKLKNEQEKLLNELDAELDDWVNKTIEATSDVPVTQYVPTSSSGKKSSGGRSAYSNPALDSALRLLEHRKRLNQISTEDEIAYLNQIKAAHVKTAEELMDINERIYAAEQALMDETLQRSINWINERKALGELSIEEEIEAWERVKNNQSNNIEAVKKATLELYRLRQQVMQETFSQEERNIQHLTRLGVLSVKEQINAYKELYQLKAQSLQEEQSRIENLFELYKQLISNQQRTIKVAYDERIELIEEEAKKRKQMHEEEIAAIERELELLNRQEEKYDHDKRMNELKEELAYWQVRTSEEAREKVAEILKQIDEEEHRREVELKKQSLEDKKKILQDEVDSIDETAKKEREKWEKSYKEIEIAFDEHSIDMIALASAMWSGIYDEFEKNYLIPLENALRNADYGSVESILGGIDDFAQDAYNKTYNTTNAQVYRLAAQILEFKRQYEYGGDITAHQRAIPYYDALERLNPTVAETLRKMYYKEAKEFVDSLPKAHTGAEVLTYGAAYLKPGELIFPPDLSSKLEELIKVLYKQPVQNLTQKTYDNRKEVRIGNLLHIERNYMEDEVDAQILARELSRAIKSMY